MRSRFAVGSGYVLSLLLACGLLLLLHRGALPVVPPVEVSRRGLEPAILAYFGLWLGVLGLRSWRWGWLVGSLGSLPRGLATLIALVGHAALLVLPYRSGEAVRPLLMRRHVRFGFFQVSGTVAAERVVDAALLGLFTCFGLFGAPSRTSTVHGLGQLKLSLDVVMPLAKTAALSMVGCALLVWILALLSCVRVWAERTEVPRPSGVIGHLRQALVAMILGLSTLQRPRLALPFVAISLCYWLLNALSMWWLLASCGEREATFGMACTAMGLLGLGIAVPTTPGYFGSFQLALYLALALYVSETKVLSVGVPVVFFAYLAQVGLTLAVGAVAFLVLRSRFPVGRTVAVSEPHPRTP